MGFFELIFQYVIYLENKLDSTWKPSHLMNHFHTTLMFPTEGHSRNLLD